MQTIKCVIVGDGAVGKTCLVITFTTKKFPHDCGNGRPRAIRDDHNDPTIMVGGQPYKLSLIDTAGQDDYDQLRPMFYRQTDIFLLCFSVVHPTSFENIKTKWLPEINHHCPKTPILLVGTQMDLRDNHSTIEALAKNKQRPVSTEQGEKLAKELKAAKYVECSSMTQKGLKHVFDEAVIIAAESLQKTQNIGKCIIS